MPGLVELLFAVIIGCIVLAIAWYIVGQLPIPPQFRWIVNVAFALIVLVVVIEMFPYFGGGGVGHFGCFR